MTTFATPMAAASAGLLIPITIVCLVICGFGLAAALASCFQPLHVATDQTGILIKSWRGSSSLQWPEIVSCCRESCRPLTPLDSLRLQTGSGRRYGIPLAGFTLPQRKDLCDLIVERSHLIPECGGQARHGGVYTCYVREGYRTNFWLRVVKQ